MSKQINATVKEQLIIAEKALRKAVEYGSNENPYTLGNIVEALKQIDSVMFSIKMENSSPNKTEFLAENCNNDYIHFNLNDTMIGKPYYNHVSGGIGCDIISF